MNEVISQVEGKFRECGFKASLSKPTINHYVKNCIIGSRLLSWGTTGSMPTLAFDLLVLAVESFMQIPL
jgi:hypothetical protein